MIRHRSELMAVSTNRIETWTWWAKRSLFCISTLDVVVVAISESTVEFKSLPTHPELHAARPLRPSVVSSRS
jgi:hypothetical protein